MNHKTVSVLAKTMVPLIAEPVKKLRDEHDTRIDGLSLRISSVDERLAQRADEVSVLILRIEQLEKQNDALKKDIDNLLCDKGAISSVIERVVELEQRAPVPGPQGEPGKDGRDGIDGKDGAPGLIGPEGPAGKDGDPGRDGRDGQQGVPGRDGAPGLNGKDGVDGKDGLGFEDMSAEYDGERTVTLKWQRGDQTKEFTLLLPIPLDQGTYRSGAEYQKGDMVTFGGSSWIAQQDTTAKPEASPDWRLAVKRGRDGKDGKPGEKGERGLPGKDGKWQ